jgi:hypothetical protein
VAAFGDGEEREVTVGRPAHEAPLLILVSVQDASVGVGVGVAKQASSERD